MSFLPSLQTSVVTGIVAGLAGFVAGQHFVSKSIVTDALGIGERAIIEIQQQRFLGVGREINLWNQAIDADNKFVDLVEYMDELDTVSGEARAKMQAELRRRASEIATERQRADAILEELKRVKSDWGDMPVPDDIVCRVMRGRGCPDIAGADGVAGAGDNLAVRDGSAGTP